MDFYIKNRAEMKYFFLNRDYLVISISTPESPPAKIVRNAHTLGILRLWFDDLDRADFGQATRAYFKRGIRLFTEADAYSILNFVRVALKFNNIKAIVCHCDAGISRSSGTAAALSKILNGNDFAMFKKPYVPNMLVYRTILEVHDKTKLLRKWEK